MILPQTLIDRILSGEAREFLLPVDVDGTADIEQANQRHQQYGHFKRVMVDAFVPQASKKPWEKYEVLRVFDADERLQVEKHECYELKSSPGQPSQGTCGVTRIILLRLGRVGNVQARACGYRDAKDLWSRFISVQKNIFEKQQKPLPTMNPPVALVEITLVQ